MSVTEVGQQQLLIGGEWAGAGSGETFDRTDPYTGELATRAAAASRDDARAAADAAAAAFGEWSATPPSARRELLQKAAMAVRQPAGVVVGIAPWNAPIILATRAVATPLAFGNTVVLKASEVCPRTHGEVGRAIADAACRPA